ncbi:restriction endonuclease subunit S [Verrucomicrobiales bacterium]|nr:restriction endonuclease subunit S [Verrucomicrobiales bacterium]
MSITRASGLIDQSEKFKKRVASSDTSKYKVVESGDLVVGFPIDEGVLGFQGKYPRAIVSPAYDIWRVKEGLTADRDFLEYYFRSPRAIAIYTAKMRGAVNRRRVVPKQDFLKIPVPFPPLAEQKRIAAILDAADDLRAKRREAIEQLDELLQATFLDLFGDPVTNPKGWEVGEIQEGGNVVTGSTPPSKLEGMFDGPIPFVTPGDLKESWTSSKRSVTENGAAKSRVVEAGATFVCCIGATIGKMGKALGRSAFNQQINAIEWGADIESNYGLELMRFYKEKIASDGASTTLPILKKSLFQKISIPLPPFSLQQQFADTVSAVEEQKARYHNHLDELDTLFASLQSRAFKGEL